jgi:DNA-binding LytR/AlgR family response regulator
MSTARILIADDEVPARSRLRRLVEELNGFDVVGEAAHGRAVLDLCGQMHPDIVLLDIRMPDMDGIEAARHLAKLDEGPAVIFTTAYDSYAMEAFDAQAIGYLCAGSGCCVHSNRPRASAARRWNSSRHRGRRAATCACANPAASC